MPRPITGTFDIKPLADGSRAFRLRFPLHGGRETVYLHEQPDCMCGCGGGWDEPRARNELRHMIARVAAGIYEKPAPPPAFTEPDDEEAEAITFGEYAPDWLRRKVDGELGDRPLSENTENDYRWRLLHLTPFFATYPLDEIDAELCLAFKAAKLREARELRQAIEAGADIRDTRNRRVQPLGPSSIRKLIDTLATILDDAIEDDHLEHNGARSKRMRVRVPKKRQTFLEMDELASLIDAATEQDTVLNVDELPDELGPTTRLVAHLLVQGKRPAEIAKQLGVAKGTVSWHLRRLGANVGRGYVGRRVICEILGRCGPRVSELCDLRIGEVRLHDPSGARFDIPDAKTETGIREVQMTPDTVEAVVEHIDRLRRAGRPTGPDDYLVPNLNGGRMTRQRVAEIVAEAAAGATRALAQNHLPPLPNTSPHTLRRTYISIALLANNFDVKWVMAQVGHADSKMTMDVYAQLEQRVKRDHGASFDRLVRQARTQLHGFRAQGFWSPNGPQDQNGASGARELADDEVANLPAYRAKRESARGSVELDSTRFSVVCSTN